MVGLIKAVDRYDPDRGVEFSTFAIPTILGEIRRHFRDTTWSAHVPRSARQLSATLTTEIPHLTQRLGREPTTADLALALDLSEDRIVDALRARAAYASASYESMAQSPGESDAIGSLRGDDAALAQVEQRADLRPALARLPERQRLVVGLRYFCDRTQTQIAEMLGVSPMHISRLLSRSREQLRHELEPPTIARGRAGRGHIEGGSGSADDIGTSTHIHPRSRCHPAPGAPGVGRRMIGTVSGAGSHARVAPHRGAPTQSH
jgi:RNA polymerase sigma-B factor